MRWTRNARAVRRARGGALPHSGAPRRRPDAAGGRGRPCGADPQRAVGDRGGRVVVAVADRLEEARRQGAPPGDYRITLATGLFVALDLLLSRLLYALHIRVRPR